MNDRSIFRDVTFSQTTRDQLERAADLIRNVFPESAVGLHADADAIEEVVARWDANDEMEIVVPGEPR